MVRVCRGLADGDAACCFAKSGGACQPQKGRAQCTWCDPESLAQTCAKAGGRARLKQLMRGMPKCSQRLALSRLPHKVYEDHFEAEFGDFAVEMEPETLRTHASSASDEDMIAATSAAELDVGDLLGRSRVCHSYESEKESAAERQSEAESSGPGHTSTASGPSSDETSRPIKMRRLARSPTSIDEASVVPQKKPAARKPRPKELCPGLSQDSPCPFSSSDLRQPARIQPERCETHCPFCSASALAAKEAQRLPGIAAHLKKLAVLDPGLAEEALQRIEVFKGTEAARKYRQQAKLSPAHLARPNYLDRRKLAQPPLSDEERKQYEEQLRKDRQFVRRKVLCPEHKGKRGKPAQEKKEIEEVVSRCGALADLRPNDVGLPAASSATGRALEAWCKQGSWQMCEGCGSMQPRRLQPVDLKKTAKPTCKKCSACRADDYVPCLEDVPEPLRGLSREIIEALRPLEIDVGLPERPAHGYRVHTQMICFAWAPHSVDRKIKKLPKKARRQARAARKHLLNCRDSDYFLFDEKHADFLQRHGNEAELQKRKRPLRFIEEEGGRLKKALMKRVNPNRTRACHKVNNSEAWSARCDPTSTGTATSARPWPALARDKRSESKPATTRTAVQTQKPAKKKIKEKLCRGRRCAASSVASSAASSSRSSRP